MATASRADQRRARVLEATIAAIADVGVDALRMTDISDRAGMTPGHILYYFGNKDRILIETLRWSEHDLAESRRSAPVGRRGPRRRLRVLVDDYLPQGTADARWNLWMQVGIHPPSDHETRELLEQLIDLWRDDLIGLVRDGIDEGVFAEPSLGLEEFARRGLWFLDGLSMSLLSGSPRLSRDDAVDIGLAELERSLL
jgi:AcrR family transcriptional regulator